MGAPPEGHALCGRYRLGAELGRGGMSIVHRARDLTLGREVAVKVIRHDGAGEAMREELRERFRREAGAAARIPPHPNVVRIYDYGTDPGLDLDFIVMELLEGRDLKQALQVDPPAGDRAVRLLIGAARGIAAGHRAGIVHRDVKPANVFLVAREPEGVRILDFGIAKAVEPGIDDELTRVGQLPHSPAYASPEQLLHGGSLTPASDVYQLGLVAYELLARARPFTADDRERIAAGEQVPLPDRGGWTAVAPAVKDVVARALDPDPLRRYPDASELADALEQAAGEDATRVLDPATSPPDSPADATLLDADPDRTAYLPGGAAAHREPATGGARQALSPLWAAWRTKPQAVAGGAAALVLLLLLLIVILSRGDSAAPPADPEAAALDQTFRELQSGAARRLDAADE